MLFRVGQGFDIHNWVSHPKTDHPLILGGVCISEDIEVQAHSDGDALIHALIDAILGALGQEDIGDLFPPSSPEWEGISGQELLSRVLQRTSYGQCWEFGNIDLTIVLQKPHLGEKKLEIRRKLQEFLQQKNSPIPISVKAKTFEKDCSQVWVYASISLILTSESPSF